MTNSAHIYKTAWAPVLLLAACTTSATHVRVVGGSAATADPAYVDGANAWAELSFAADTTDSGEPECEATRDDDCQVTIIFWREAGLREKTGADAITDRYTRTVIIDARWDSWALLALVAHESGHVLLDTGRHTPEGVRAVMAARGAEWSLQPADLELACETIQRGCK